MILDLAALAGCLAFILGACLLFANAVEWLGKIYNLGHGVVGTIFAAIGTALPETIIPIIAILFVKGKSSSDIGIGAIVGAPFMLVTLAFFVTGIAVIYFTLRGKRTLVIHVKPDAVSRDLIFFIVIYGAAIATSLFQAALALKAIVALGLVLGYVLHLRLVIAHDSGTCEVPEDFYLHSLFKLPPTGFWIYFQVILSLGGIIIGAHYFIKSVESLSHLLGLAPLVLSVIITPIATELPEKLNSVIWTGQRKDTLALGNITGAMVFQSCIPVLVGMLFTDWKLDPVALASAVIALSMALIMYIYIRITKKLNPFLLLLGGVGYAAFLYYTFGVVHD
jgi:cation:H+ antiporter